ncbi:hypothetical protein ACFE04_021898 [Oxalis oulophora]
MRFGSHEYRECEASRQSKQFWYSADLYYPNPTKSCNLPEAPPNYQQGYVVVMPETPPMYQIPHYHPPRHVPEAAPIMRHALFVKEDSIKCDVDKEADAFIKYEHKKFERKLQPIKSGEEFLG